MDARQIIEQIQDAGSCVQIEGENITVEPLSNIGDELKQLIQINRDAIYQELNDTLELLINLSMEKVWLLYEQRVARSEVIRVISETDKIGDYLPDWIENKAEHLALRMYQARGKIPSGWNQIAECHHCGKVWSEHTIPALSCDWCWMRIKNLSFPQPD